jgi:hypothetical protein
MLTCLLFIAALFTDLNYPKIFGADYQKAVDYCRHNQKVFQQKADQYKLPATELKAIIFPELIRHSSFKDFFETSALELLYTNGGTDYADFSIGHFQMKPSFVEKLETALENDLQIKARFPHICAYAEVLSSQKRVERLKRLKDTKWQLNYLCCFYAIACEKFEEHIKKLSPAQRVAFLSAAYNIGFDKSLDHLLKWSKKACFPFGAKYPEKNQFVYSDIAQDFFNSQTK